MNSRTGAYVIAATRHGPSYSHLLEIRNNQLHNTGPVSHTFEQHSVLSWLRTLTNPAQEDLASLLSLCLLAGMAMCRLWALSAMPAPDLDFHLRPWRQQRSLAQDEFQVWVSSQPRACVHEVLQAVRHVHSFRHGHDVL